MPDIETSDRFSSSPSIPEKQEDIRWKLAVWFSIWYWCLLFLYVYISIFVDITAEQWNLLSIMLASGTWFVWTILWFYFGQTSNK